jgi:hypothetical protein
VNSGRAAWLQEMGTHAKSLTPAKTKTGRKRGKVMENHFLRILNLGFRVSRSAISGPRIRGGSPRLEMVILIRGPCYRIAQIKASNLITGSDAKKGKATARRMPAARELIKCRGELGSPRRKEKANESCQGQRRN